MIKGSLISKNTAELWHDLDKDFKIPGKYSPLVAKVVEEVKAKRKKKDTQLEESQFADTQLEESQFAVPDSQVADSQIRSSTRKRRKTAKAAESESQLGVRA